MLIPWWDRDILMVMRIISRGTLRDFWTKPEYKDSEQSLRSWFQVTLAANWSNSSDIKSIYGSASIVGDNRIVFNIAGNKYRLVVKINYHYQVVYIRFIGTHKQYDKINVKEI